MSALARIAKRHGLVVIEDAAHAPGASWRGRPCGAIGGVGCFSFFSNKNLPVGEGGMIVTSDDELAARLRLLRSHGMTTLTWARHRGHATSYDVLTQGFNYRLDEIHAAVGLHQLRALPARNAARGRLAAAYADALHDRAGIVVPFVHPRADADPAHHIAVVCLPQRADRDDVRAALQKAGIQTSVHYPPIHTFTAYADLPRRRALPRTDEISSRILTLPLHPGLGDEDVELVTTSLLEAVALAAAA
jgi:dTDP-4-amino-4,6-dideoxygalactose transaminase